MLHALLRSGQVFVAAVDEHSTVCFDVSLLVLTLLSSRPASHTALSVDEPHFDRDAVLTCSFADGCVYWFMSAYVVLEPF